MNAYEAANIETLCGEHRLEIGRLEQELQREHQQYTAKRLQLIGYYVQELTRLGVTQKELEEALVTAKLKE